MVTLRNLDDFAVNTDRGVADQIDGCPAGGGRQPLHLFL